MSARVNARIVQTRKMLDKQGQEIITSSKVMLTSISEQRAETESTVSNLRQEINQSLEQVDSRLHLISSEVKFCIQEWESRIQSVKHANDSEFMRISKAISSLEVKITAGVANDNRTTIQQTAVVRTTAVGQTESTVGTVGSDTSVNKVNGMNACNLSTCSGSAGVPNTLVNPCNNNVNAGSRLYADNTDRSELILPDFHGQYKSSTP
jgi:uncharacterized protein YdcH (DUF465 family)